ncbi:MAG: hypothetical protein JST16_15005 [Bdellovibrionales bacterium]|nr:hypothetical protein [Bdellovibrionales bacterium]
MSHLETVLTFVKVAVLVAKLHRYYKSHWRKPSKIHRQKLRKPKLKSEEQRKAA